MAERLTVRTTFHIVWDFITLFRKAYNVRLISGIFHLISLDQGWPWVTNMGGKTMEDDGLTTYCIEMDAFNILKFLPQWKNKIPVNTALNFKELENINVYWLISKYTNLTVMSARL